MGNETALRKWGEIICSREAGSRLSLGEYTGLEGEAMKELDQGMRKQVEKEGFQIVAEVDPRPGYVVISTSEDKRTEENRGNLQFMLQKTVYFEGEKLPD